ncbi:MAG TPA: hypothetical protein VFP58_12790 [Candidatus Eisenbacteria bacterium]|nr:hypothetical protein [Candidatus Eisenbacteria bacterium]
MWNKGLRRAGMPPATVARILAATAVLVTGTASAYDERPNTSGSHDKSQQRLTVRRDGRFVHNVGRLQLQLTNIGQTGNTANPALTTVPSAEYPPGSGHDHLFAAGLWIGAIDASGIPHVTTAAFDIEFSPEMDPQDICVNLPADQVADIREAYEGIPGGNRVISSSLDPDDDGDGQVNEDFLNGLDDDLDGLCDEDYSAIGQQMFATEYRDDLPTIRQLNPEHVPLGVRVRQTSYAWSTPGQSDFVGMDYHITNLSGRSIRNVYVAIFADPDVGSRAVDLYFRDDQCALFDSTVTYVGASGEPANRRIQMAYAYDNPDDPNRPQDNQGGDVPGYFGCMFLNHTVDPSGVSAPQRVGITAFKFFAGEASFEAGGDPENDAQRYQLMSDPRLNPNSGSFTGNTQSSRPLDYRFIMATGPFSQILPDSTLTVSVAWVAGLGLGRHAGNEQPGTLIANAKAAQQVFDGLYADLDNDQLTGVCGKESCLRNTSGGRAFTYRVPDACKARFHADPASEGFPQYPEWDPNTSCENQQDGTYVCPDRPDHCASEDTTDVLVASPECVYVDLDCDVNTGLGGRERSINWVAAAPLPAPFFSGTNGRAEPRDFLPNYATSQDSLRVSAWFFPGDSKVTLKWNDFAERIRDAQRGNLKEFVGYRIYKAAGWSRPEGTNAPSRDLWILLGEWRKDPKGSPARNLGELIDPAAPIISTSQVQVRWDPVARQATNDSTKWTTEIDTVHAVGRYSFVDTNVLNGFPYFYSIVPVSIVPGETASTDVVLSGNPSATNAQVVFPRGDAQPTHEDVYVVPNPYKANAEWDLVPRDEDPSGTKVLFTNLPATRGTIHVYTLAGDLVIDLPFDGTAAPDMQYGKDPVLAGEGSVPWNLISRNGQKIVSGIYLYSVDTDLGRQVGKFVVIR